MESTNNNEICRSADFIIDSSQIIRKSQINIAYKYAEAKRHHKHVPLIDTRLNYIPEDSINVIDWCPQPVILYTHTEDCNPSVCINEYAQQLPEKQSPYKYMKPLKNYVSTDEAQIQYLASNPVCFLVCGKPGLDEQNVAKDLATFWNCCHLDPVSAIEQEIESKSRSGRFIEYNLRSGRAIGGDVIINVIKQLVKSNSSRHKGFVISGLPLIPNELFDADEPLASEAAVYVAEQILDSLLSTITKQVIPDVKEADEEASSYYSFEDEFTYNELGSLVSDASFLGKSQKFDLYLSLKNQLNDILNCFQPPFMIIYLKSLVNEVLIRRDKLRYDIHSNQVINLSDTLAEMVLHPNKTMPFKRLAKEVRNFGRNVRDEVEHYAKYVQPILDQFILNHDQQYVITIDARLPLSEINEAIRSKLNTLPLQKVVTVEKFSDVIKTNTDEEEEEGEETDEEKDSVLSEKEKTIKIEYDFTDKTCEDVFRDFQNLCTVGPRYRWQLSHWRYNCPVALRHGRIVTGKPTYGVRFMNQIYFLENQHAMCLFIRNPRPYLLLPNPQFPGKIYLFGVEHCGARDVAMCLSYVYNLGVVDITLIINEIRQNYIRVAIEEFRKGLIEEHYENVYQTEIHKWEILAKKTERERQQWLESILKLYAAFQYQENELMQKTVLQEIKRENPFWDSSPRTSTSPTSDTDSVISVSQIEDTLRSLNVPVDTVFITEALENPGNLFVYIPKHLERIPKPVKRMNVEISPDVLTHIDNLTKIYRDEKLREEDFTIAEETLLQTILNEIHKVENKKAEDTNNYVKKSGWIIVNAKTSSLVESLYDNGIVPNTVLYFYDDDVDSKFLVRKYSRKKFVDYHLMKKFFKLNGFESAAARCPELPPNVNITEIHQEYAKDALDLILKSERFKYVDKLKMINGENSFSIGKQTQPTGFGGEDGSMDGSTLGNNLFTKIEEFDNEWDLLSMFFLKLNIVPIQVNYARDIEEVMLDTIRVVNSQFRKPAKDFDDDERIRELTEHDMSLENEEEELDEEPNHLEMLNRNLGDTLEYCPIALLKHNVLWKGKNDFGAMYENKLYFFSNEHAKEMFIANPSQFVPFRTPKQRIPPLRICIVGPIGSGKTTIGQLLAKQFGLIYVNYLDLINKHCLPKFIKAGRKNKDAYITENIALKEYNPNEQEDNLFHAFLSYFEGRSPLPAKYLNRVLPRLWQQEPYSACGLLLDGFPFIDSDFEYMANSYLIPDVVISLRSKLSTSIQRSLDELLTEWKRQKLKILQEIRDQYEIEITQWKLERQKLYKELLDLKIKNRIEELLKRNTSDSIAPDEFAEGKPLTVEEATIEAKNYEEEDNKLVLEQVDLELEKPVMDDELETQEDAEIRLTQFIEDSYADECTWLQPFEQLCEENSFPFVEINANRPQETILLELLHKLDAFKMRNESFLEKTFSISLTEAKRLLNIGYFFLSNYGYSCPVQMYEDQNTLQLYHPRMAQKKIYPVRHRQYIYFLNDTKSLKLFEQNPLKYTQIIKKYPIIAFRVAIIGPPKCGKTSLAERFANEFGFQVVTRGEALRYVLHSLPSTLLACRIDNQLRRGEVLDHCLVMEAVEVLCSRSAAISQGIVFDGFPLFSEEMELLFNSGLTPHLVINLESTFEFSKICLANHNFKRVYLYSEPFMQYRYCHWLKVENIKMWIHINFQNIIHLQCKFTNWSMWNYAKRSSLRVFRQITHHVQHFNCNKASMLKYLSVSPHEMIQRLSVYKNYCICCWVDDQILYKSKIPINRQQLIQFRSQYFFICSYHLETFLQNSVLYGETFAKQCNLPKDLPKAIDKNSFGDLKSLKFAENGHCIVCYIQSTSFHRLVKGSMEYIIFYKQQYYTFCSNTCQKMFMQTPEDFTPFKIHLKYENNQLPKLDCNSLPTMGYLQQTQGHYLVKACTRIGMLRPKYPKLSGELSGLIYFGLYLKMNNPKTKVDELNLYKKYMDEYERMCNRLKLLIRSAKRLRNPYLKCDLICSDKLKILKSCTEDDHLTTSTHQSWKISSEEMSEHDESSTEIENEDDSNSLFSIPIQHTSRCDSEITFFTP